MSINNNLTGEGKEIYQKIKMMIMKGELAEGEPLPSISSLATTFNVKTKIVKKAYDSLEEEGLIKRNNKKLSISSEQNKKFKLIEEELLKIIKCARTAKLSLEDLKSILDYLDDEFLNNRSK